MPRDIEDGRTKRFPGTYTEYAIFHRDYARRDPNGWKMLGRPTSEHATLRDMVMPDNMLDSNMHGVPWVDSITGIEYKIMECTVTRTDWRTEAHTKRADE